ncbi:MAG: hypothetical protein AAB567_01710 [Patescibacteria group bacterium]
MKRLSIKKIILFSFLSLLGLVGIFMVYFSVGSPAPAKEIFWGVNFSPAHATTLGLDWQETYVALLDDLKVRRFKLAVDWDRIEPQQDLFHFNDIDWQLKEAEKRKAQVLLVVGMKTSRWPECHIPEWAKNLPKREQQKQILSFLEQLVLRYKDSSALLGWQIENEPLFPFGKCPWRDRRFLAKETQLVKSLDRNHPIIISDSGEFSLWIQAAKLGDFVSTTMYRKVWFRELKSYVEYPLSPVFYARKAKLIHTFFGKEVIVGELQAEPWGPGKLLSDTSLQEQEKSFDLNQFKKNILYAKRTGLREFYLWGAEWWYWLKKTHLNPTMWQEAKNLFHSE